MALAFILGPRVGKYGRDGKPRAFPAHNIPFVVTGTFILLFGWMGFNPGSTLAATDLRISVVAVNTNLAAVAGASSAMVLWYYLFGKPDVSMACNGMLAGLVAITAPCAFVGPNSAVIIGLLAGIIVCLGVLFNERIIKVDDPCGAISVHVIAGGSAPSASASLPTARMGLVGTVSGRRAILGRRARESRACCTATPASSSVSCSARHCALSTLSD
jgi:Amt family ammonium transporter